MPAPPLSNDFEGGVSGNNIQTSDTGSGDAWDTVVTTGGTLTYDNAHAYDLLAGKLTNTVNDITYLEWTGLGTITGNVYIRTYFYFTAFHASASVHHSNYARTSGANVAHFAFENNGASPAGRIHAEDNVGNIIAGSVGAVSPATNQWIRFEARVLPGGSSTGQVEWRLYNNADSATITETKSVTGVTLGVDIGRFQQGIVSTTAPTSFIFWMDEIAVSTTDWLGPAVAPAGPVIAWTVA